MSGRFVTLVVLLTSVASCAEAQSALSQQQSQSRAQLRLVSGTQPEQTKPEQTKPEQSQTAQTQSGQQAISPSSATDVAQSSAQTAQQPPPPSNGPTLAETTQWIEAHLTGIAHGNSRTIVTLRMQKKGKPPKEESRQNVSSNESVSVAKFEGCVLTLGLLTRGDDYSVVTVNTIPFDRLTSASWKVEKLESSRSEDKDEIVETTIVPNSVALLTLEGSTNVISYRRRSTGSIPLEWIKTPFEGALSALILRSDDHEMPPRLVNAFNHAIQLCHKNVKPEPF